MDGGLQLNRGPRLLWSASRVPASFIELGSSAWCTLGKGQKAPLILKEFNLVSFFGPESCQVGTFSGESIAVMGKIGSWTIQIQGACSGGLPKCWGKLMTCIDCTEWQSRAAVCQCSDLDSTASPVWYQPYRRVNLFFCLYNRILPMDLTLFSDCHPNTHL